MYRDEGEAILARARALTQELKAARNEIARLERQLRGEPEPDPEPAPSMTPTQREINAELTNARSILAGLLEEDPSEPLEHAEFARTYTERDLVIEALQRALLAVMARKMGEVPHAAAAYIETLVSVEGLIKRIVDCAMETDETRVHAALRREE